VPYYALRQSLVLLVKLTVEKKFGVTGYSVDEEVG
jgi:hypothetical protein